MAACDWDHSLAPAAQRSPVGLKYFVFKLVKKGPVAHRSLVQGEIRVAERCNAEGAPLRYDGATQLHGGRGSDRLGEMMAQQACRRVNHMRN